LTVDTTAPVISLDNPVDFYNETATGSVVFNYTANDSLSNIDTCELWGNWSGSWQLNETFVSPATGETNGSSNITLEDGIYLWSVYCNDTANNYNNTVGAFTLTVDTNAPLVLIVSPTATTYTTSSVNLDYVAIDTGLDSVWYTKDSGVTNTTLIQNITLTSLSNADYTLILYANDTFNNVNETNVTFTISVSSTAPTTSITPSPTGGGSDSGAPPSLTEFSSVTSIDISKGNFIALTTAQGAGFTSKGVNYIADVKQIGEDFVKIWVYYPPESTKQIEPVEAVISVGKRANIDLDGDSWADVSIELRGIKDGNAFLYFKELKSQGPSKISIPTGEQVFVEEVGEEDFELPKITLSPKDLISKKGFMGLLKNFESFVRSKVGQFELPKIMLRAKALITGKLWSKLLQDFENLVRNNVDCWVSNVKTKKSWLLPSLGFIALSVLFIVRSLSFYLQRRSKGKPEGLSNEL